MNERDRMRDLFKEKATPKMLTIQSVYRLWAMLEDRLAAGGDFLDMRMNPLNDKVMLALRNKGATHQLIKLTVRGSYFDDREAITFDFRGVEWIGFCGWASSRNEIPFVEVFEEWCNLLAPARSV